MARDLAREFLGFLRVEKGLSRNTLDGYERDLRKLISFAARRGREILTLERADLLDFMKELKVAGLGPQSVARTLVTVRSLY